jgi:hypothetical protein
VIKFGSLLFVIVTMTGCPWPKPVEPPTTEAPEFQAVQSSHGAIFAWSGDKSLLVFQGATDAESQKAALDELSQQYHACQEPPCGKPLPAAAIQEINDTFANQPERLGLLGNYQAWQSSAGDSYLICLKGQIRLPDIVQLLIGLLPCIPEGPDQPDCIPPVEPPKTGTCR